MRVDKRIARRQWVACPVFVRTPTLIKYRLTSNKVINQTTGMQILIVAGAIRCRAILRTQFICTVRMRRGAGRRARTALWWETTANYE